MTFDFDDLKLEELHARRGVKWSRYGASVLPAWIAEMDYPVAPPIRDAIAAAVERGDLGYPPRSELSGLPAVFAARMADRFGWEADPDLALVLPDVMRGVYMAIDAFTAPGDPVVVQTPVYPPFLHAIEASGRIRADSPLLPGPDGYALDLDGLRGVFQAGARLMLLCNPQNPTGRVLDRNELRAVSDLALEYEVVVVADEIHADLVYGDARHIPLASLGADVAARTLTLHSASKAFNIAGLRCAVLHAGSGALRERLLALPEHTRHGAGILGLDATHAAWTAGDAWLLAALDHLDGNRRFMGRFLAENLPTVGHHQPQATFLGWLDVRAFELPQAPAAHILATAGVALGDGADFGPPGVGHVRLTFATSRPLLGEIMKRVADSLGGHA